MKHLSIDIETYSSENLAKCGVYRYCQVVKENCSVEYGPTPHDDIMERLLRARKG